MDKYIEKSLKLYSEILIVYYICNMLIDFFIFLNFRFHIFYNDQVFKVIIFLKTPLTVLLILK